MKMAHAPPGHHSVVGRPSVGGLSFPEYVIYRGKFQEKKKIRFGGFLRKYIFRRAGLSRVFNYVSHRQTRAIS